MLKDEMHFLPWQG